ncbi:hypothetical protein E2C01_016975 [Portunus trituberculatus]|uniref:Uncharacterized protein n=1 Tax=Portunus trituberculatus TaxID=210409 RepID=A0A5B7DRY2_PORTR|nr:hypothetical protein [Portunus trituberculatus]
MKVATAKRITSRTSLDRCEADNNTLSPSLPSPPHQQARSLRCLARRRELPAPCIRLAPFTAPGSHGSPARDDTKTRDPPNTPRESHGRAALSVTPRTTSAH